MASSKQPSTVMEPSNTLGACFDPLDVDSFINFDQLRCPSPSMSPLSSRPKLSRRSTSASAFARNNLSIGANSNSANTQIFSGPSHQYDQHKQTTAPPVEAFAGSMGSNSSGSFTLARQADTVNVSTDDAFFNATSSVDEFIDFNVMPHNPSLSVSSDVDMDFDTPAGEPLPAFFFSEKSGPSASEFVNPSAIGGQEGSVAPSPSTTLDARQSKASGRLYPGVHQQQAATAKAQQQQRLQQRRQIQHTAPDPRAQRPVASQSNDPIVEERISRLLNSMRQSSVAASSDDDALTPNHSGVLPHIARMRKEEEDMDEDERLLASEQGKKLSSKERRQLRNKVSARAFRSRRKEYIGQLEGEIAARTNEASDLKAENAALREENTRLSDLTRMLLSSSAFSTFLDDLSTNGMRPSSMPAPATAEASAPAEVVKPNTRKDADPFTVAQQQLHTPPRTDAQVGMTLVPDHTLDFSSLDLEGNGNWALGDMGNASWGINAPQVFSVLDVPQGPAVDQIDTAALAGKSSNVVGPCYSHDEHKDEAPVIERMPAIESRTPVRDGVTLNVNDPGDIDESDPAFALFSHTPTTPTTTTSLEREPACAIESEKVSAPIELIDVSTLKLEYADVSASTMDRFHMICESMEGAMQRINRLTAHL
ncbi:MAG: hypothetical protein M1838_001216 [Thelocarpon superellum]|nr:MAG: hypothetical protein M1838_001216 [Thelocarpon superellum]